MKTFLKHLNEGNKYFPKAILTRRSFLKGLGFLISLYFIPASACKRLFYDDESHPEKTKLSKKEKEILSAIQLHILPEDGNGPGALKVNALEHYEFVLSDKHLDNSERKLLVNGIKWAEETAIEMYKKSIVTLTTEEKEEVLRDLETYRNGEKWLSKVVNYIFEALLGAPAYGINTNMTGWKWLDHTPGFPQPLQSNIYGTYGYGL